MQRTLAADAATSAINGDIGRVAALIGVTAILAVVCLILLYTVGQPFGTANDVLNGAIGVLSAVLAVLVFRAHGGSLLPVVLAIAGAAIAVLGSWLVISGTTGFVLAGYVSGIGFALVGGWLLMVIGSDALGAVLPTHLVQLGWVVGGVMLLGVVGIGGVVLRIDSFALTPWWLWLAAIGWLGTYVLYPAWCLLVWRSA